MTLSERSSSATASVHDHILIVLKYDALVRVDVEHRDRGELGGYATCLGNAVSPGFH